MQDYIAINGVKILQPDAGMGYNFETTFTQDTQRVQSGVLHSSGMFTVESFSYTATGVSVEDMKTILQLIAKGRQFTLHYFSPYFGEWRDDKFYVGKGSLSIGRLNEEDETFDSLSFNMVGVNPI